MMWFTCYYVQTLFCSIFFHSTFAALINTAESLQQQEKHFFKRQKKGCNRWMRGSGVKMSITIHHLHPAVYAVLCAKHVVHEGHVVYCLGSPTLPLPHSPE